MTEKQHLYVLMSPSNWWHIGSYVIDGRDVSMHDYTQRFFVKVDLTDKAAQDNDVEQALRDSFSYHSCGHEHDCCGCLLTIVTDTEKLCKGYWKVTTESKRNF